MQVSGSQPAQGQTGREATFLTPFTPAAMSPGARTQASLSGTLPSNTPRQASRLDANAPAVPSQGPAGSEATSISFHHWQPPAPAAPPPSSKQLEGGLDFSTSPKKRKATGPHTQPPPPAHQSSPYSAPSSSAGTPRAGHSRATSNVSGPDRTQAPTRRPDRGGSRSDEDEREKRKYPKILNDGKM
jgi:hypothetical protein